MICLAAEPWRSASKNHHVKSVVAVLTSLFAIGLCATSLVAQQGARLSAEVSVGVGFGHGAEWENRELGTLDGLVAWRVRPLRHGALLLGASGGVQGSVGGDAVCTPASGGGCRADYPRFAGGSVLAGWEAARARSASLWLLAGPTFHRADVGGHAVGVQARVELATPPVARLALVGSARAMYLPAYRGDAYLLQAFGLGLRIQ